MEIPVCPICEGSKFMRQGVRRRFAHDELRSGGWTLVDSSLELEETDYSCANCGYDPSDDEDDSLLELLGDFDTAPADDIAAD